MAGSSASKANIAADAKYHVSKRAVHLEWRNVREENCFLSDEYDARVSILQNGNSLVIYFQVRTNRDVYFVLVPPEAITSIKLHRPNTKRLPPSQRGFKGCGLSLELATPAVLIGRGTTTIDAKCKVPHLLDFVSTAKFTIHMPRDTEKIIQSLTFTFPFPTLSGTEIEALGLAFHGENAIILSGGQVSNDQSPPSYLPAHQSGVTTTTSSLKKRKRSSSEPENDDCEQPLHAAATRGGVDVVSENRSAISGQLTADFNELTEPLMSQQTNVKLDDSLEAFPKQAAKAQDNPPSAVIEPTEARIDQLVQITIEALTSINAMHKSLCQTEKVLGGLEQKLSDFESRVTARIDASDKRMEEVLLCASSPWKEVKTLTNVSQLKGQHMIDGCKPDFGNNVNPAWAATKGLMFQKVMNAVDCSFQLEFEDTD
ncbi:unnamed protein product [Clonostachys rosea]|uniref:Uncharacterized protein n=1 Tax=Bionectria ochroleuca TaxID=29856 RepID=A0ABY6U9V1_BIOOC|nr:unnamed protein product [Clonostachys rosea]